MIGEYDARERELLHALGGQPLAALPDDCAEPACQRLDPRERTDALQRI